MAAAATSYDDIRRALKQRRFAPVYLLHGEEGFFTDQLVKEFENILTPDEKDFNQFILFGPQVDAGQVLDACRAVPMMADHQVVILKEAQAMRADRLEKLAPYVLNPVATTIFVICFRGEKAKGKDLLAAVRKSGAVVCESPKIRDYNLLPFIEKFMREKGLSADPKALEMMRDFIGSDLSRMYNEIEKLAGLLPPNATVTPEVVERHVGVSKDYNTFELVDAIAARDAVKVFRCLEYFRANPKANPLVMVVAAVFNFFADLLTAYYAEGRTDQAIMADLKMKNTFGLRRIRQGMANYTAMQVVEILSAIRAYDVQSKGIGSRQSDQQLFFDLAFHILSAPGRL